MAFKKFPKIYRTTYLGPASLLKRDFAKFLNYYPPSLYLLSLYKLKFPYNCNALKLVSAMFYQIFIFSPNGNPSKIMKNVFISSKKSSICSQDVQFFVIFPFLSTLPDSKGQMEVE